MPGIRSAVPAILAALALGAWSCPAHAAVPGQGAAAHNFQRFAQVKTWRLRVTWNMSGHTNEVHEFPGGGSEVDTWSASLGGQVDFKLVRAPEGEMDPDVGFKWVMDEAAPAGGAFDYEAEKKSVTTGRDGKTTWTDQRANSAGVKPGGARLELRRRSGQYGVFAYMTTAAGSLENQDSEGHHDKSDGVLLVMGINSQLTGQQDWTGELPTDTTELMLRGEPRQTLCTAPLAADGKRTVEVSWTLTPWEKEPPSDVTFDVAKLEDWQPDPDDPLDVHVAWKGKADQVRVTLSDVSSEPGTCLNSESTDTGPDLDLPAQGEWVIERSPSRVVGTLVLPIDPPSETSVQLAATDYGAWGTLKVEVHAQGAWKQAREVGTGRDAVPIPEDRNNNHIADAWERENGAVDAKPDEDKDNTPTGNGQVGDGLTVYEEYRGFMEAGKHIRTAPGIKDLFLSDQAGGKAAAGVSLFQSISSIAVHSKLTAGEMGESRIINRNHGKGPHVVDQHGIPIKAGAAGSTPEAIAAGGAGFGPPVKTAYINMPNGGGYARTPGAAADPEVEENISTVAHELGHGVGLQHHGEGTAYVLWWTMKDAADGSVHFYEQDCIPGDDGDPKKPDTFVKDKKATEIRVFREADGSEVLGSLAGVGGASSIAGARKLTVGWEHSEYSGDASCVMRYTDPNAYMHIGSPLNYRYLPDGSQWTRRDRLCTDATGTGVNAPDHAPWSRFGNADSGNHRGNCRGQIVVSDKYAQ